MDDRTLIDDSCRLTAEQLCRMADLGSWKFDPDTDRVTLSAAACVICGLDREGSTDLSEFKQCFASPGDADLGRHLERCVETGESGAVLLRLTGPEPVEGGAADAKATERRVRLAYERVEAAEGGPASVVGIVQDVTPFLQIQTDLDARCERLETALTNSNVGLWDWNATTNEVYFSPTAKVQLGHSGDESWTSFHDWESRLHPEDRVQALEKVRSFLAGELDEYKSVFRLRCQDGHYIWVQSTGRGMFTADGTAWRVTGVHVDVTEQVEVERALKRRNEELQQFAFVASHDLQAPLRAVSGFAELLLEEYGEQLDGESREYAESIAEGCGQMRELISDLLAYSRIGSNRRAPQLVDLNTVVSEIVETLQPIIDETSAAISYAKLPACWGDRTQLTRLFLNLIGNGLKYRSEAPPRISVTAELHVDHWHFVVSDNGLGIALEDQRKIFDVFHRLHESDEFPGTGIGLAICRKIVDEHGGHIWVESHLGQGSRFCFTLPVHSPLARPSDGESAPNDAGYCTICEAEY